MMEDFAKDCIRCGRCTRVCSFLEKYNIDLKDLQMRPELAYHCFLCGRCKAVCPKAIDGVQIAIAHRQQRVQEAPKQVRQAYRVLLWEKSPYKFANYRHARPSGEAQQAEKAGYGETVPAAVFMGCNFPSFFPETTKALATLMKDRGIGSIYDCCSKPVAELGFTEASDQAIGQINQRIEALGLQEIIMVCPNCYWFLKDRLTVPVVSIYEKLQALGLGRPLEQREIPLYYPCPDREEKTMAKTLEAFLPQAPCEAYNNVQCCGLGGCAGVKEPELAQAMGKSAMIQQGTEAQLYTYCATCVGNFRRRGMQGAYHVLPLILGIEEQVPLGPTSLLNRIGFSLR